MVIPSFLPSDFQESIRIQNPHGFQEASIHDVEKGQNIHPSAFEQCSKTWLVD